MPSQVEIGLVGMSETGLAGIVYEARPPRIDLQADTAESRIEIRTTDDAKPGSYTVMVRASVPEGDGLIVSRLYPVKFTLDVQGPVVEGQRPEPRQNSVGVTEYLAIAAIIGLVGLVVYRRFRQKGKTG